MELGFKISLAGHGLVLVLALFAMPVPDRIEPPEVVSVTLVSDEPSPITAPPNVQEPEPSPVSAPPPAPAPPEMPDEAPPPDTPPVPEATTAIAPPPPAPRISDSVSLQPEVTPEFDAAAPSDLPQEAEEEQSIPEQEPASPPPSTTEIVTEAEQDDISDEATTPRMPMLRPADLTILPQEAPPPVPQTPIDPDVADILREVVEDAPTPVTPAQPLSSAERDGFRVAVQSCWVVDVGSQAANITVTVGFSLTQEGKVEANSLKLISAQGEPASAVNSAFQTARRAILRCQKGGYALPKDKYDTWRDVEMTFNPKDMRIR